MHHVLYQELTILVFNALLFIFMFISIYFLMLSLLQKRMRWNNYQILGIKKRAAYVELLRKWLWISQNKVMMGTYEQLFAGCGLKMNVIFYHIIKRLVMILCALIGILAYFILQNTAPNHIFVIVLMLFVFLIIVLCIWDKALLEVIKKNRKNRIIQEVYVLSNQLLYFSGSNMNLHSKLIKCIPYTQTIRNDMYILTSEWYEGAESAIRKFKFRLGTDEGFSFAETLNSLRLHESDHFYDLLKQRVLDYKEKIDLLKESKKETKSYILFVLAGIPILNTFRVFIYPWVREGQKLFDTLN